MDTTASLSIRYIAPTRAWRKGRYDSQNSQNPPYGPGRRFRPVLRGFQPRPDSSGLHHPPHSLANRGIAETREIFRAVGGVLQG